MLANEDGFVCCVKKPKKQKLTAREREVLALMVLGKSNTQIARELTISTHTAKAHVGHILEKFEVHDRVIAVVKALKAGLVD